MADIKPTGTDIATGQAKELTSADNLVTQNIIGPEQEININSEGTIRIGTDVSVTAQAIAIGGGFDAPNPGEIWLEPAAGSDAAITLQGAYGDAVVGGGTVGIYGGFIEVGSNAAGSVNIYGGGAGIDTATPGDVWIGGGYTEGAGPGGIVYILPGEPRVNARRATPPPTTDTTWGYVYIGSETPYPIDKTEYVIGIQGPLNASGGGVFVAGADNDDANGIAGPVLLQGGDNLGDGSGGGFGGDVTIKGGIGRGETGFGGDVNIWGGEGQGAAVPGTVNIGTSFTSVVNIGQEGSTDQQVNIYNSNLSGSTMNMGTDESPLIQLQYTHFKVDARGRSIEVGPIYYDPNTGETIKIGTQITACIYLEGDGSNNTVRGGNGSEKHVIILATQPTDQPTTYDLADTSIDPASPMAPGSVTIRSMLEDGVDYSEVTDDGSGSFPVSSLLPSGGTVDYTTGALTGTTATLRTGVQVNAIYELANANGEPLTPKGGDGTGSGDGGTLRLQGGKGGDTGDGANVEITSGEGGDTSGGSGNVKINTGTVTSGTVGGVDIGTGGVDYWTVTNAGNLEKQAQGKYILTERRVVAQSSTPVSLTHGNSRTAYSNEGASAEIVFNLPSAAAGMEYTFIVQDEDGIKITAASGDVIQVSGTASSAGGTASSTTIGSVITLLAINATEWFATSIVGNWTTA